MAEYQNPQQEPGTERRLLLVFALTFLVIMLFQPILKKYMPQPPAPQPNQQAQSNQAQPASTNNQSGNSAPATVATSAATPTRQASTETETIVENDLYRIVFTNRGAQVKSWTLKKWDDDSGQPLDLVNQTAAAKFGYPLSLWTYSGNLDDSSRNKINSALYAVTSTGSTAPADITFEYSDGDLAVRKIFHFDHSYVVGVQTSVQVKGSNVTAFPMWPSGFGDQITAPQYAATQIAYQDGGKVERLNNSSWSVFPSIKAIGGGTVPGPFHWAGVSDQYFAAIFMPTDPQNTAMVTLRSPTEIPHSRSDPNEKRTDKIDVFGAAVGDLKGATETRLYVGPKALGDLEAVHVPGITGSDADLRSVVDFGWWGLIARPLFLWLKWTYQYVHNWGWAILIQTVIINVALLPLRLSQMKSMLKMQRVAPQIKAIQEKYKKYSLRDPRKAEMNTEISELYKREGVNPAGGCLPLIIQMPFLFAYYRMLGVAIDLRHAPWLWIHDLAAPDPRYILPIAIVVTMFAMQRMTPQGGMDPSQQRMMNVMMPVMMGFISFNLPSGLGLYWAAGQLIGIVQQTVMNRTSLGREMREMMEKRARKKDK
ncbi:MAG TPA: membrane protein insertase YidC [Terriglobales bacterium]|nr:membrane protein insertase YidC [Terriglobales bacterium]